MEDRPFFSIIIPVKNEASLLNRCLESLSKLDYPKERLEIIVADGLSTDNTKEVVLKFGVKVVDNKRQVVVSGRNSGFKEAKGDIIVFTDADCIFDKDWLKNSVRYFNDSLVGGVGGPTLMPPESSGFEKAVNFLFSLAEFLKATSHRQDYLTAGEVNDIPGCNAIYRRSALEKVMPVDENFLTAEDAWMNFCIRNLGYRLIAADDVRLWHCRRSSPRRFLRQIYRFAIGRLQVGKRNHSLLNKFHIMTGLAIPAIFSLGIICYSLGLLNLFFKIVVASSTAVILLSLFKTKSLLAALNVPLVMFIFLFGWSAGFLRELFFPLKDVTGK